jgi:DNA-binding protein HU-beta
VCRPAGRRGSGSAAGRKTGNPAQGVAPGEKVSNFGSAALFIIVAPQLAAHPATAAGLAAAFSASFWWVLAFTAVMLIPVLFLPGAARSGAARSGAARSGAARSGAARSGAARSGAARSGAARSGVGESGASRSVG